MVLDVSWVDAKGLPIHMQGIVHRLSHQRFEMLRQNVFLLGVVSNLLEVAQQNWDVILAPSTIFSEVKPLSICITRPDCCQPRPLFTFGSL